MPPSADPATVAASASPDAGSVAPVRAPGGSGSIRSVATGLRMASHVAVWVVLVVPTAITLADGWRPVRDDAMISIGAYRVFTADSPLVGVWSLASQGMAHAFFDVGPLLFWVLAVPVRLDPGQGALWGATLACAVALSVAIEGAWRVQGWPACVAVALVAAVLGWQTQLYADVLWNPHIGLVFFTAAIVLAWVVASGRFGWWPPAILFASLAAQCHFLYVVPAIAVAGAAPLVGLALGHRPSGRRWWVASAVVTAFCWLTPLAQEVFVHPGNLTLILRSGRGQARVGLSFGLHALATSADPRPIFATPFPYAATYVNRIPQYITGHATGWAVVDLVVMVAVGGLAWRSGRRSLSALAAVSLVVSVTTVVSFATLPADNLSVLSYLINVLWVVGTLQWIVVAWVLVEVAGALLHARSGGVQSGGVRTGGVAVGSVPARSVPAVAAGAAAVAVILLVAATVATLHTLVPAAQGRAAGVAVDRPLDAGIAAAVERTVPRGPVIVRVTPSEFGPRYGYYNIDTWGVAFVLLTHGWHPGLTGGFSGVATHLTVPPGAHWPTVTVMVDPADRSVVGVRLTRFGAPSPRAAPAPG